MSFRDRAVELRREELAWAAGFFDGEGSTGVRMQHKRSPVLRLSVSQVDRRPLDRFMAATLGLMHLTGPRDRGGNASRRSPIYEAYTARFEHAQAVIALLWPWLSPGKREQAADGLKFFIEAWSAKEHRCQKGHPYTGHRRRDNGAKVCVECRAEAGRRYKERRRLGL